MKTLKHFINESKAPKEGKSTWKKTFNIMVNDDENSDVTLKDFEEVQDDDWIYNVQNGEIVNPNELYSLYKKHGDREITWVFKERSNEYVIKDGENMFYFMVVKPYENGL